MLAKVEYKKRLIVLLPECMVRDTELARVIHELALEKQMDILFLTLLEDEEKSLSVARSMVTLKALTGARQLMIQSRVVVAGSWLRTLKETFHEGDIIVCFAEQTVRDGFFRTRPISAFLPEVIQASVISLAGYYHPRHAHFRVVMSNAVAWIGSLLILAAFSILELNLDSAVHDAAHMILLVLLMVVEFSTLLVWNNWTSR